MANNSLSGSGSLDPKDFIGKNNLNPKDMKTITSLAGLATSVSGIPKKYDTGLETSKYGDFLSKNNQRDAISNSVSNAAFNPKLIAATGGASAVVGGILKLGDVVDKLATDKYGRTKNKGLKAVGTVLNPIKALSGFASAKKAGYKNRNEQAIGQKNLFDRSEGMKDVQNLKAMSQQVYGFQDGGVLRDQNVSRAASILSNRLFNKKKKGSDISDRYNIGMTYDRGEWEKEETEKLTRDRDRMSDPGSGVGEQYAEMKYMHDAVKGKSEEQIREIYKNSPEIQKIWQREGDDPNEALEYFIEFVPTLADDVKSYENILNLKITDEKEKAYKDKVAFADHYEPAKQRLIDFYMSPRGIKLAKRAGYGVGNVGTRVGNLRSLYPVEGLQPGFSSIGDHNLQIGDDPSDTIFQKGYNRFNLPPLSQLYFPKSYGPNNTSISEDNTKGYVASEILPYVAHHEYQHGSTNSTEDLTNRTKRRLLKSFEVAPNTLISKELTDTPEQRSDVHPNQNLPYLKHPSERLARVYTTRFNLQDLGMYDPQKRFRRGDYTNLKKMYEANDPRLDTDTYELFGTTKPKARHFKKLMNRTFQKGGKLSPMDQLKQKYSGDFLNWWFNNPEMSEWVKEVEGEDSGEARGRHLFNTDKDKVFDYEKAWKAGDRPVQYKYDDNKYHWGSTGKGPEHSTTWKADYMEASGINPDTLSQVKQDSLKAIYDKPKVLLPKKQKGGKLADCGCSKGSDGIDTDILHKFPEDAIKTIQIVIGSATDGKYKDSDKDLMKSKAKEKGMKLVDFLNEITGIKSLITTHSIGGRLTPTPDVLSKLRNIGKSLKG